MLSASQLNLTQIFATLTHLTKYQFAFVGRCGKCPFAAAIRPNSSPGHPKRPIWAELLIAAPRVTGRRAGWRTGGRAGGRGTTFFTTPTRNNSVSGSACCNINEVAWRKLWATLLFACKKSYFDLFLATKDKKS
jgi:hypothetical protein